MQERKKGKRKVDLMSDPSKNPSESSFKKIKKSDFALFLVFRRRLSFLLKCLLVIYLNSHERLLVSFDDSSIDTHPKSKLNIILEKT